MASLATYSLYIQVLIYCGKFCKYIDQSMCTSSCTLHYLSFAVVLLVV